MSGRRASADSLMGALKEVIAQSERVAKAEVRLAIATYADRSRPGARRVFLVVVGASLACFAIGYLIFACFLSLSMLLPAWQSASIIAVVLSFASALLLVGGLRSHDEKPSDTGVALTLHPDQQ